MADDSREPSAAGPNGRVRQRLEELGIALPPPPRPVAAYAPWVADGDVLYVSGQISTGESGDLVGKLGQDASLDDGIAAARLCALNLLSQIDAALDGDLDRLDKILRLTGFVNVAPGFHQIPQVVDGCSALLLETLGERGRHARAAVGVAELPRNCLVEVEAMVKVRVDRSSDSRPAFHSLDPH